MIGRKGEGPAGQALFMIALVIFVGILVAVFSIMAQKYLAGEYQIPEGLEEFLVTRRLLGCFGAENVLSGREFHLAIDPAKLTKQVMDQCYTSEQKPAYQLQLRVEGKDGPMVVTSNWANSPFDKETTTRVRVFKDGGFVPGEVILRVQR